MGADTSVDDNLSELAARLTAVEDEMAALDGLRRLPDTVRRIETAASESGASLQALRERVESAAATAGEQRRDLVAARDQTLAALEELRGQVVAAQADAMRRMRTPMLVAGAALLISMVALAVAGLL
jgi:DNA repair exonuclease SbcCD ATPase subunit